MALAACFVSELSQHVILSKYKIKYLTSYTLLQTIYEYRFFFNYLLYINYNQALQGRTLGYL